MRLAALFVVAMIVIAVGSPALATLTIFPSLAVQDLDGKPRTIASTGAKIVCWEDEQSSKKKQDAHAVVGRYSDNKDNRSIFELVVIADLERWDFWPARSRALASIKKTQTKESTPVWVDWKGALRKSAGLKKGESAFFVVDTDGKVRYFAQGILDSPQQHALDDAIASLGAKPAPGR